MRYILVVLIVLSSFKMNAQNVGVGTTTPVEKLDVNGNVNITGTIKVNGIDGTANQVLMKNSSGVFQWGSLCDYKDVAMFFGTGPVTWTVPAGVTRIFAEAWGAGGGGSAFSGGGGGAYSAATFTVAPGDVINIVLGDGGTSGTNTVNAGFGGSTTITAGPNSISAGGGSGAPANFQMSPVAGGIGNASGAFTNWVTIRGGSGKPGVNTFTVNGSNTYEVMTGADGGSGANSEQTGGLGAYRMSLVGGIPTIVRNKSAEGGKAPGGGGGGGFSMVSNTVTGNGNAGSYGMVIIHY